MIELKKLSCFICALAYIYVAQIQSQVSISVQPGFNSFGGGLQFMPDRTVRVIGLASDDWWYGVSFVSTTHFSSTGEFLSVKMFPDLSLEDAWGIESFPTRQGHTIVVADLTGCDFGVPLTLGSISKNNSMIWSYTPINFGSEISGPEFYLRPVGDTIFRLWSPETVWNPEKVEYYSLNGLQLPSLTEYTLYDKVRLTNDGFVMSANSVLTICDTTFMPMDSVELSSMIQAFDTIIGGGFVCATYDSLYILDAELQILKSNSLPAIVIDHVFATSTDIWYVDSYTHQFHRFNMQLENIATYQLSPRIALSDILHVGDTIFVTGNFTGRDRSMVLFRTTPETFSLDLNTDLGITNIRMTEQATSTNVDWGWPGSFVRDVTYGPVYVTLRNSGSTHINETAIRFQEYACPSFCEGILQYEWHLTNLNLSPGDEREVYLGNLAFQCTNYEIEQLCLYTFNPGNEPDIYYENDMYCVTVDVISDVKDITEETPVSIYPNPVSDILYIDYPEGIDYEDSRIAIIDSRGQHVWQSLDDQPVTEIHVDDLQSGVYFLLIHARSSSPIMKKIVVI